MPASIIQALTDPSALHYRAVAYVYWQQFIAHKQLAAAASRAHELGVLLQMEVPVGVSLASADVWYKPSLVKATRKMASPPDALGG